MTLEAPPPRPLSLSEAFPSYVIGPVPNRSLIRVWQRVTPMSDDYDSARGEAKKGKRAASSLLVPRWGFILDIGEVEAAQPSTDFNEKSYRLQKTFVANHLWRLGVRACACVCIIIRTTENIITFIPPPPPQGE